MILYLILLSVFLAPDIKDPQPGERIISLYIDQYNTKWFGTDNCLLRQQNKKITVYYIPGVDLCINDLKSTEPNILWLATSSGVITLSYNKKKVEKVNILDSTKTTFRTNNIVSISFDRNNNGYFSTFRGIGIFSSAGWRFYTRLIDITKNEFTVSGIKNDTVYIGTRGEGVARIFRKADVYSGASSYVKPWSALPNDTILSLLIDSKGNQWYGTANGLCRHSVSEAKEGWNLSFNKKLPGKRINSLAEDVNGNIWVGTTRGLAMINNMNEIKTWNKSDGLASDTVNVISINGNSIWIGTNNGISVFNGSNFNNFRISEHYDKIVFVSLSGIK